ncbi:MAG: monovalent cation/H(+) antiporter subunit G [Caldiserica bacterium]|nr:monovalent cation/H(+) antiporter subunit G [Caldisericota bacterium]
MSLAADLLLGIGVLLLGIGGLGLSRFRDSYSRLQAAGVGDLGGALLVVAGAALRASRAWEVGILGLLGLLLLFTGPVATHAVAKGAFLRRHAPREER